jgi:hypothetical protein
MVPAAAYNTQRRDLLEAQNAARAAKMTAIRNERRAMALLAALSPDKNSPVNPDPEAFDVVYLDTSAAAKSLQVYGGHVLVHRASGHLVTEPAALHSADVGLAARIQELQRLAAGSTHAAYVPQDIPRAGEPAGPAGMTSSDAMAALDAAVPQAAGSLDVSRIHQVAAASSSPTSSLPLRLGGGATASEPKNNISSSSSSSSSQNSSQEAPNPWWKLVVQKGLTMHTFYVIIVLLMLFLLVLIVIVYSNSHSRQGPLANAEPVAAAM